MHGGPGGQCATKNYAMPWIDNFCEKRAWRMPLCPSGTGHQGVDIRPARCRNAASRVVAVENGVILDVDREVSMVKLRGSSGIVYRYLHVDPATLEVSVGQAVTRGASLARISNVMNGARQTTWHLHFDIQMRLQTGAGATVVFVPPYSSLIVAYRKLKVLPSLDENGRLGLDSRRELTP